MPFAIILNDLRGFDLIVKALDAQAKKGCVASGDLAAAIPSHIFTLEEQPPPMPDASDPRLHHEPPTPITKKSPFRVIPGGQS